MSAPTKDRITCHVLDTTTGRPARGLRVRLEGRAAPLGTVLLGGGGSSAPRTFESLTDEDGRILAWLPYSSETASGEVPVYTLDDVLADADEQEQQQQAETGAGGTVVDENRNKNKDAHESSTTWTLRFDTEAYFASAGKPTFFPEVMVSFRVKAGEHYHVPLLLSQYSYTTYRGS